MRSRYVLSTVALAGLLVAAGCRGDEDADVREFESVPPNAEVVDTIVSPRVPPAPE